MPVKVGMISLGCPKNQVDGEVMLSFLRDQGFSLIAEPGRADVVIINTCGFIEDAKRESIENILEMCALKKEGTIKGIVVTGCLAERYYKEMATAFPEVNCVLTVGRSEEIAKAVTAAAEGGSVRLCGSPEGLSLGGQRIITTLPFYSYLKIAEGCDNHCSYCVIPKLRGRYRSRPMEELVEEASRLAENGVKELTVVAQDTTRYGEDLYGKLMLPELLRRLARIEKLEWIRILYGYPDLITDELIDTMAEEPKIVKYIDMPIQHVNARISKLMNRRGGTAEEIEAVVSRLRAKIPGITLRTTVITGFPGETDEEFAELCEFLKKIRFERLGAFAYSREEGTPAWGFENQIGDDIKQRRQEIVMEQQDVINSENNQQMLGKSVRVLTEGYDRYAECYFGRSQAEAPDIDGKIFFKSKTRRSPGEFVTVTLDSTLEFDLIGEALESAEHKD